MKKTYILEGLSCAHCAGLIEEKINQLPNVNEAFINFGASKLIVEYEDEKKAESTFNVMKEAIKKIEYEVELLERKSDETSTGGLKEFKQWVVKPTNFVKIIGVGLLLTGVVLEILKSPLILYFYIPAYLLIGKDVFLNCGRNLLQRNWFDENFLMTIATIGAFAVGEYQEAVAVLVFYQIGEYFQDVALKKSRGNIQDLIEMKPEQVNLIKDNEVVIVMPEEVRVGDLIMIKPGEVIPLDCEVVEGDSVVNNSALTGESLPIDVTVSDELLSGSINVKGLLKARVTQSYENSTVSKVLEMVENASSKKAVTEKFITKFAKIYTPAVIAIAAIVAIIPPIVTGDPFGDWLYRALIFLVIACPCGLVISIPLSFFGGIGAASKQGILVKGGNYLEALAKLDTIVFDKTGTLTKGDFEITHVKSFHPYTDEEILRYGAMAENFSNHPIAKTLVHQYKEPIEISKISDFKELSGKGVSANIEGNQILAGNEKLMAEAGIGIRSTEHSQLIIHVAINHNYAGCIALDDKPKPNVLTAIESLRALGVKTIFMLTGDRKDIGERIGKELNIDKVYAQLLPHEKLKKFEEILDAKTTEGKTAFVGDGINDVLVLSRADVSISMGGMGSGAAIDTADIVLMNDDISKIADGIRIGRFTNKIVKQNIVIALGIKLLVMGLGVFGMASLWEAVFADVGVALIAVLNARRVIKQ